MTETGYQIWLFVFGFMGDPAGHENTRAKSRELLATPLTRHRSGECTSVAKSRAFQSSLALVQNVWANEMKKSLSAASAGTLRCALLIGVVSFVVSSYSPCSSPGLVWKYMCDMRERTTWRRCYPRLFIQRVVPVDTAQHPVYEDFLKRCAPDHVKEGLGFAFLMAIELSTPGWIHPALILLEGLPESVISRLLTD